MTMTAFGRAVLPMLAVLCCARAASAQSTLSPPTAAHPIQLHNPAGPAELAQYDFLAGDWDVIVTRPRAGAEPLVSKAAWHNRWIANGTVMMQEWRDQYGSGVELRSFNRLTHKWDGHNLYMPDPGIWYTNEAMLVGAEMIVTTLNKAADGTSITRREVYRAIHADQFVIRTEVSRDAGLTWKPGGYSLVATRAKR